MSKVASFFGLALIQLDKASEQPLHRQIYDSLRQAILEGRLQPGSRLPSTRALAQDLGLARNTVSRAFEQLLDEGYLETKVGSGTRVIHDLPDQLITVQEGAPSPDTKPKAVRLSERGQAILKSRPSHENLPYYWQPFPTQVFSPALPALDAFPFKLWERAWLSAWRDLSYKELGYGDAMGYLPLRKSLADYMQTSRGVRCTPEQVVITNGTQQSLSLITDLLLNKGDTVWLENPSFNGIRTSLQSAQADLVPVAVDDEGMQVETAQQRAPKARLVYISPSHQYPLGVTMSLSRRLKLLNWASEQDAWIVEDDYNSAFRYAGYPIPALQGLDQSESVIYMGTFSKVLFPALRLAYMVVPKSLIEPLRAARARGDRGLNLPSQVALRTFIEEGHFARHIRRMRALYVKRQACLIKAARSYLKESLKVSEQVAGLHLVGWLPKSTKDSEVSAALLKVGIDAPALSSFALKPLERQGLVLGYTAPEEKLIRGIKKAAHVFSDLGLL